MLLGRAGQIVLAHHPAAWHVRLDGPVERRARRGGLWEGLDIETARARLIETDEARARYTCRLYQRDPVDPSLYHVILDVTVMSSSACVELLAVAADAFWRLDDSTLEETMRVTRGLLEPPVRSPEA